MCSNFFVSEIYSFGYIKRVVTILHIFYYNV